MKFSCSGDGLVFPILVAARFQEHYSVKNQKQKAFVDTIVCEDGINLALQPRKSLVGAPERPPGDPWIGSCLCFADASTGR
jgi:hypothetical protein